MPEENAVLLREPLHFARQSLGRRELRIVGQDRQHRHHPQAEFGGFLGDGRIGVSVDEHGVEAGGVEIFTLVSVRRTPRMKNGRPPTMRCVPLNSTAGRPARGAGVVGRIGATGTIARIGVRRGDGFIENGADFEFVDPDFRRARAAVDIEQDRIDVGVGRC